MQKITKNEWTVLQVLCQHRFVDVNINLSQLKCLKFGPNKNFLKNFQYVTFEHLWMSSFMQKIKKSEQAGLQVLAERRFVDLT